MFLGTVIYALLNSAILGVVAIGFNLPFGISGVANFAYGAMYILSAYLSWMLLNLLELPYGLSVVEGLIFFDPTSNFNNSRPFGSCEFDGIGQEINEDLPDHGWVATGCRKRFNIQ